MVITLSDTTSTDPAFTIAEDYIKNPNPPRAQSKLHRFAIVGVPESERVHFKFHSMRDFRRLQVVLDHFAKNAGGKKS
ncbi:MULTISPECIES: hypothetical protein [unclassified Rhizobium]|uniref:hypothetical protein n=1 Tax=unclassified Rhizobium TaxID=2613769 RepID=UPI001ADC8F61|nr:MULTISPECIES: hypothetical protein [unclassified Rhizobium]MBO9122810.1 hypothetical protein [Rhizobium sp. 16-488-2b]MBO9173342.1 hypothetical protein [Rhizobium sp. 16-488-2a]